MSNAIWPTTYGAYGGCTLSGNPEKGNPGVGFAAVNNALALLSAASFGAAGVIGAGGAGGGGGGRTPEPPEPPETQCDVFIGVVTEAPTGGYGAGTVKKVVFQSDGTWTAGSEQVNVIFPRI